MVMPARTRSAAARTRMFSTAVRKTTHCAATKGNDILHGDDGNDAIRDGSGHDTVYGGAGNDGIKTGSGNDVIYGGYGADIIVEEDEDLSPRPWSSTRQVTRSAAVLAAISF
jgi:RTX calcium-binding nonapeptide repeat (4 copies)